MEGEDLTDWMHGEGAFTLGLLVEGDEMTVAGDVGRLMAALCCGAAPLALW